MSLWAWGVAVPGPATALVQSQGQTSQSSESTAYDTGGTTTAAQHTQQEGMAATEATASGATLHTSVSADCAGSSMTIHGTTTSSGGLTGAITASETFNAGGGTTSSGASGYDANASNRTTMEATLVYVTSSDSIGVTTSLDGTYRETVSNTNGDISSWRTAMSGGATGSSSYTFEGYTSTYSEGTTDSGSTAAETVYAETLGTTTTSTEFATWQSTTASTTIATISGESTTTTSASFSDHVSTTATTTRTTHVLLATSRASSACEAINTLIGGCGLVVTGPFTTGLFTAPTLSASASTLYAPTAATDSSAAGSSSGTESSTATYTSSGAHASHTTYTSLTHTTQHGTSAADELLATYLAATTGNCGSAWVPTLEVHIPGYATSRTTSVGGVTGTTWGTATTVWTSSAGAIGPRTGNNTLSWEGGTVNVTRVTAPDGATVTTSFGVTHRTGASTTLDPGAVFVSAPCHWDAGPASDATSSLHGTCTTEAACWPVTYA